MTDKTPERIWVNSKYPPTDDDWNYCSTEDDFDEVGVQYIRVDLHAAVVEERDQLKAAMKEIMCDSLDVSTRFLAAKALEKYDG